MTEHAVRRPGESLLVVTIGLRHAARIEEALRAEVAHNLELRRWLDVHWTGGISEPFPSGRCTASPVSSATP